MEISEERAEKTNKEGREHGKVGVTETPKETEKVPRHKGLPASCSLLSFQAEGTWSLAAHIPQNSKSLYQGLYRNRDLGLVQTRAQTDLSPLARHP